MQCQQQRWKHEKCLDHNLLACVQSLNKYGLCSSHVEPTDPDPVEGGGGVAILYPVLGKYCC